MICLCLAHVLLPCRLHSRVVAYPVSQCLPCYCVHLASFVMCRFTVVCCILYVPSPPCHLVTFVLLPSQYIEIDDILLIVTICREFTGLSSIIGHTGGNHTSLVRPMVRPRFRKARAPLRYTLVVRLIPADALGSIVRDYAGLQDSTWLRLNQEGYVT